ncbi:hypothetical protein QF037_003284 [Streptomyces canus]|nr:hypothetical protein [Streptomyces canus]
MPSVPGSTGRPRTPWRRRGAPGRRFHRVGQLRRRLGLRPGKRELWCSGGHRDRAWPAALDHCAPAPVHGRHAGSAPPLRPGWRAGSALLDCESLITCGNAPRSRPRLAHRARHTPASSGIRLHTREDPALSITAGYGVSGHLIQGAPGRIRTCAHGSGEHANDMRNYGPDLRGSRVGCAISSPSHAPHTHAGEGQDHFRLLRPDGSRRREGLQHPGCCSAVLRSDRWDTGESRCPTYLCRSEL